MKLIADSGSTNCTWVLSLDGKEKQTVITRGINPFYQSNDDISFIIRHDLLTHINKEIISEIYFYSAGCAFPDKIERVQNILYAHIPSDIIEVNTDLLAAARALCGNEEGIACILGTGSNSCLYNGQEIEKNVLPLGFILGDEGSGAAISKLFIGNLLKNQYPKSLYDDFMDYYQTNPREIMDCVYSKPFPNRYLAQFTKFIAEHISNQSIYELVFDAFTGFITRNIMQYDYTSYPVYFTGSVAWHFSDVLKKACFVSGIFPADIRQSPMEGLVDYHK
jgi:N-acetylglucosamine kinase-like BadF-type ATPase